MKASLKPGIQFEHRLLLNQSKMVPALYPEAPEFQEMPSVFATGFMVGFLEWACLNSIIPHLDWPREQTVGTHVDFSHEAATPAGMSVVARVELIAVDGRKLRFYCEGFDDQEMIAKGHHERFVIDRQRFDASVQKKLQQYRTNEPG